jgi:cell division protein FtsN
MPGLNWSDRAVSGFVVGLLFGIGLSAVAAFYITHSPVPFVNKVQRPTENVNPGAGGQLPDPNKPLYSNRAAIPVAPPATAPGAEEKPPAAAAAAPAPAAPAATAPAATADASGRVMLQTGAFKSAQDADAMRARLALLGLDARVSQVTQDAGATVLYRVRIGPYRELDDLSGIRRTLSENGIEAQVVRSP